MILVKTIDILFVAIRYGVWGMSILGIPLSIILCICNLTYGINAFLACLAALLICLALALILAPQVILKHDFLLSKRYILGTIFAILALISMGIAYLLGGALPVMNLLFL